MPDAEGRENREMVSATRPKTPEATCRAGWGDTMLVGAVTGLIISIPVMMAMSMWLKTDLSADERVAILVLGPVDGSRVAAARRRWCPAPPEEVNR